MEKEKFFRRALFSADVIREASVSFERRVPREIKDAYSQNRYFVRSQDGAWTHDNEEEFFADYRKGTRNARYVREFGINLTYGLLIEVLDSGTAVTVSAPNRPDVEGGFEVFEKHLEASIVPQEEVKVPQPKVFIGHGRSPQWRNLKDHLHEQHGYEVVAYEVGARAGHTIRDILDDMLGTSSFAILVMSAEDKDADGKFHARPNVIHELGLFQGKLGFSRAIVLLEAGTEEFSNIHGIQQIRYGSNNIRETYGDVLATLKREFDSG
jgi:predicted nucleotide-binding protein